MPTATYKNFCDRLEVVLTDHESKYDPDDNLLLRQIGQLKNLIGLECRFRDLLPDEVFVEFVRFITYERCNILDARPYFRERSTTFIATISDALKTYSVSVLRQFRLNWSFIEWARRRYPYAESLVQQIARQRSDILEQNLPLAISQARIFWNSTPHSHLSWMDVVQIQCKGLLLAIDKFVPPVETDLGPATLIKWKSFRAVAIGIMRRDRVNAYSSTLLHFYPSDRAKMYVANKLMRRSSDVNFEDLSAGINSHFGPSTTNPSEIQGLLAAGSTVSADYNPDPEGDTMTDTFPDHSDSPEVQVEEHQAMQAMLASIEDLNTIEQKLLRMKGVRL
jgi:hypothetical protein